MMTIQEFGRTLGDRGIDWDTLVLTGEDTAYIECAFGKSPEFSLSADGVRRAELWHGEQVLGAAAVTRH